MHSIQTKIMALTMAAILVSVLGFGTMSYASIRRESANSSAETMWLLCENCRASIENYLDGIVQSVEMVSRYATEELDAVELVESGVIGLDGGSNLEPRLTPEQEQLDHYLDGYMEKVEGVFRSVANHTNGAVAFYYRINPEISTSVEGFLYSRVDTATYTRKHMTELAAYEKDDMGHVGWYYTPLLRGRPSWLEAYDNDNLGVRMFSYVAPLYKAGTFIGVIGMDLSYDTLISRVRDIQLYETGFAFLVAEDGRVVYHPLLDSDSMLTELDSRLESFVPSLKQNKGNTEPVYYMVNGEQRQMFFSTLSSGLKLIVTAPVREIDASGQRLRRILIFMSLGILVVFGVVSGFIMSKLIKPLRRLTDASERLAAGDYEVQLDYDGNDEVGTLTRAFQRLVEHLKIYISDLNSMAYRDSMTGVKNKAAFAISTRKINDRIHMGDKVRVPRFAVVMLDCNGLKMINDTYGHEKGDAYLCMSSRAVCDIFSRSPVLRMGGDEFTVLLEGAEFEEREELMERFNALAERINAGASEPWERLNIAKGLAVYDPAIDSDVESVLKRADELMYEDKKRSKACR